MKPSNLISIGKSIFAEIFPETVESGLKSTITFYDHSLDIHRRIENIYSNITKKSKEDSMNSEAHVIALEFKVWGMELGMIDIPLVVTAQNQASDNDVLRRNLVDLICECERIKKTSFAPTHLMTSITIEGKKWKKVHREVYLLEKWQSDEIVNTTNK